MRVLGIDPGSRITGLGIVEKQGRDLHGIASHSLRLKDSDLAPRMGAIFDGVSEAIRAYRPDVVAIEQVFIAKNAQSALVLGHARGVAMAAAVHSGVPVVEYSAKQIKLAVVGHGAATKDQVQHMVRVLLKLNKVPQADAADGLACAICHIHTRDVAQKFSKAVRR